MFRVQVSYLLFLSAQKPISLFIALVRATWHSLPLTCAIGFHINNKPGLKYFHLLEMKICHTSHRHCQPLTAKNSSVTKMAYASNPVITEQWPEYKTLVKLITQRKTSSLWSLVLHSQEQRQIDMGFPMEHKQQSKVLAAKFRGA